ncbi:MAG: sigma-70 family RNA polymerase sigma factor [Candidatus Kapaibacteriales bacterium]
MKTNSEIHAVFNSWVEDYTDSMVTFCRRFVSDIELSQDIVQDAFVSAYKAIHTFDMDKNPKSWLFSIARNKCLDHIRKENVRNRHVQKEINEFDAVGRWKESEKLGAWEEDSANLLDNTEFLKVMDNCINGLPGAMPSIVRLKYIEQTDSEEICESLDIKRNNYWQIIHRAKIKLRKCLTSNWFQKKGISK